MIDPSTKAKPHAHDDASLPGYPGAKVPGEARQESGRRPHVHAAVIKAWADGAVIEWRNPQDHHSKWQSLNPYTVVGWYDNNEYRVKPEPHKWQAVMDAYASGKAIQYRDVTEAKWYDRPQPLPAHYWDSPYLEWRIKPEVVVKLVRLVTSSSMVGVAFQTPGEANLRLTFEGDKLIHAQVL